MVKHKVKPVGQEDGLIGHMSDLILFNDDVNTFDFVIESLVEVCRHDFEQAEQCALITHFKGKCPIKTGSADTLRSMADELTRRGLTVTID